MNDGALHPDGTGNWSCDPTSDDCVLKLPIDGVVGQPDVIQIQPFQSFTEFTNPSLLMFFFLANFDSSTYPVSNVCNRTAITPAREQGVQLSATGGAYYNRLYATANIRELTCASHDPALRVQPCSATQPCPNSTWTCSNGVCDTTPAWSCSKNADCFAWEVCQSSRCVPISTNQCDTSVPFAVNVCPPVTTGSPGSVTTFCNNGSCWRQ